MARKHRRVHPSDPRKEQIVRLIEEAFADRPYPGDGHIANNPHHCPECEEADAFFRGTHWQRLLLEHDRLPRGYASPCLLTPEAQRFFLPAYLIMGLDYHTTQSGADAGGFAVFLLSPTEQNAGQPFLADGFTIQQGAAIGAFFDYLRETDPYKVEDAYQFPPPQEKFTQYWSDQGYAERIA